MPRTETINLETNSCKPNTYELLYVGNIEDIGQNSIIEEEYRPKGAHTYQNGYDSIGKIKK